MFHVMFKTLLQTFQIGDNSFQLVKLDSSLVRDKNPVTGARNHKFIDKFYTFLINQPYCSFLSPRFERLSAISNHIHKVSKKCEGPKYLKFAAFVQLRFESPGVFTFWFRPRSTNLVERALRPLSGSQ